MPDWKPPKHLARATKKWFREVVGDWTFEEHHVRILIAACESWDRCCQAREVIDRDGMTYKDRFGAPRARPEVGIERDCRLTFMRAVRELDLDKEPPKQPGRPRALSSNRG